MKFDSLPTQVAQVIKDEIHSGRWIGWLPGERGLASLLQVSRRTLTAAIKQLNTERVIYSQKGKGNQILPTDQWTIEPKKTRHIGLLTPEPLDLMRPGAILWASDLRAMLAEEGCLLTSFYGHKYFSKQPQKALARLIVSNPQNCWVIAHSTKETQQWFLDQKVHCVLAGTRQEGIDLPDIDIDFHALCFHAANLLISRGHTKIVLLLTESPGYVASERDADAGFRKAFSQSRATSLNPLVVYHRRSKDHLVTTLERLFSRTDSPTAVIVTHGLDYLTVSSFLAQRGQNIPRDVSVISRNDDSFLDALIPTPCRYGTHATSQFANKLFKMVISAASDTHLPQRHARIEPEFIKGESIGYRI